MLSSSFVVSVAEIPARTFNNNWWQTHVACEVERIRVTRHTVQEVERWLKFFFIECEGCIRDHWTRKSVLFERRLVGCHDK